MVTYVLLFYNYLPFQYYSEVLLSDTKEYFRFENSHNALSLIVEYNTEETIGKNKCNTNLRSHNMCIPFAIYHSICLLLG